MIPAKELPDYVSYDPETGLITSARVSGHRGQWKAGRVLGNRHHKGYLTVTLDKKFYLTHRIAWAMMMGEWPEQEIDHVNGVKDDNRWCNLREANRHQNMANTKRSKANKSGYKGVHKFDDKWWRASIRANGKRHNLGLFRCPTAAFVARVAKSKELHGDFARAV